MQKVKSKPVFTRNCATKPHYIQIEFITLLYIFEQETKQLLKTMAQ